jgi:hypothetical protein
MGPIAQIASRLIQLFGNIMATSNDLIASDRTSPPAAVGIGKIHQQRTSGKTANSTPRHSEQLLFRFPRT